MFDCEFHMEGLCGGVRGTGAERCAGVVSLLEACSASQGTAQCSASFSVHYPSRRGQGAARGRSGSTRCTGRQGGRLQLLRRQGVSSSRVGVLWRWSKGTPANVGSGCRWLPIRKWVIKGVEIIAWETVG